MFLKIELKGGVTYVGEFTKLRSPQKYIEKVTAKGGTINVWQVVETVHPASGEPCLIRRRRFVPVEAIESVEQVQPKAGAEDTHNYNPDKFEPFLTIQRGKKGLYTFLDNEDRPELAVAGIEYPVHEENGRKFVWLLFPDGNSPGEKHYITPTTLSSWVPSTAGYDDDADDE